jgi:shikimate kinase
MIRIFLIGYMGAGKTTLGRALAREMQVSFIDLDWYIEERFHKTVRQLFEERGEDGFREIEKKMLHEVAEFENVIVATGGGLATWQDNIERMNDVGVTIYLRRSPANIMSRLSDYGREKRPMFRGKSDAELLDFMTQHMALREPYYAKSHLTLECDGISDDDAVEKIVNYINR